MGSSAAVGDLAEALSLPRLWLWRICASPWLLVDQYGKLLDDTVNDVTEAALLLLLAGLLVLASFPVEADLPSCIAAIPVKLTAGRARVLDAHRGSGCGILETEAVVEVVVAAVYLDDGGCVLEDLKHCLWMV